MRLPMMAYDIIYAACLLGGWSVPIVGLLSVEEEVNGHLSKKPGWNVISGQVLLPDLKCRERVLVSVHATLEWKPRFADFEFDFPRCSTPVSPGAKRNICTRYALNILQSRLWHAIGFYSSTIYDLFPEDYQDGGIRIVIFMASCCLRGF